MGHANIKKTVVNFILAFKPVIREAVDFYIIVFFSINNNFE